MARAPFLDDTDVAAVWTALPDARVVGGAVRDAVAGLPVADIDLATPMPPAAVTRALAAAGLRAVPTGLAHGTVTALVGRRGIEVTTLRSDVETDGRHAVVRFTDDWQTDAARRDFTINAMSMTRDGVIHDYFGGIDDLHARRVRFVGDPATRIAEDFLRVLRYFRFHARYGDNGPDEATRRALAAAVPGLARLSPERIWSELKRILAAENPDAALALAAQLNILAAVLPEVAAAAPIGDLLPDPILRLAALAPTDPDALADRLRFSAAERERLVRIMGPPPDPDIRTEDLRRALAETPADILADRARIARRSAALIERISAIGTVVFPLHGRDLLAAGIPAGPEIGVLLRGLRDVWLRSGCTADATSLMAELARGGVR